MKRALEEVREQYEKTVGTLREELRRERINLKTADGRLPVDKQTAYVYAYKRARRLVIDATKQGATLGYNAVDYIDGILVELNAIQLKLATGELVREFEATMSLVDKLHLQLEEFDPLFEPEPEKE